ncbi:solute carrier family 35 member G1 [Lepeophtheirus salmonis]|uniref:solute carrier family 35 member G1 n=1 Tax=Lepeophtheirus salmonis TaxID=72036 RepID=UPI001AE80640|nr:solute carrier family 35 member G1-like [Lepeophtheirus salmonis]
MDFTAKLKHVPFIGYLLILFNSTLVMIVSFIVKILDAVDPFIIALIRSSVIFLLASVRCLMKRLNPFPAKNITLQLFFRGFLGSFGLLGKFYALRHMALGDSTIIFTSVPLFETFFARIFLKEPCGPFEILLLTVCLLGIILVIRPDSIFGVEDSLVLSEQSVHYNSPLGIVAALVSVFGQSTSGVLNRSLKDVPVNIITWWSGMCISISAAIACVIFDVDWVSSFTPKLGWSIFIGMISYVAVCTNSLIYRFEEAGISSLLRKVTDVLLGYGVQVIYFGDLPSITTSLGVMIIVVSVIFSGFRKIVSNKMLFNFKVRRFLFCIIETSEEVKKQSQIEEGQKDETTSS